MRVSKDQAARNRERILTEAARLFRERGLAGVGVDALADAAGMTHGSLYSQFGSKERLAEAALAHALDDTGTKYEAVGSLREFAASYLSPRHRDSPGSGCAFAALGCEVSRQSDAIRHAFTQGLRRTVRQIARLTRARSERQREDEALAVAATLVGGLVLARAVDDAELSSRILAACRTRLEVASDA